MPHWPSAFGTPIASILCAPLLVAAHITLAQTVAGDDVPADSDTIEEIVVYGDKSLAHLRRDMHKASKAFFDIYNDLNSNKDFDVKCKYESTIAVRRKIHVCRPRYAIRAHARDASSFAMSGANIQRTTGNTVGFQPGYGYETPTAKRLLEKDREMWQEISELLAEHPEFQDAYEKMESARSGYESERARRKDE